MTTTSPENENTPPKYTEPGTPFWGSRQGPPTWYLAGYFPNWRP